MCSNCTKQIKSSIRHRDYHNQYIKSRYRAEITDVKCSIRHLEMLQVSVGDIGLKQLAFLASNRLHTLHSPLHKCTYLTLLLDTLTNLLWNVVWHFPGGKLSFLFYSQPASRRESLSNENTRINKFSITRSRHIPDVKKSELVFGNRWVFVWSVLFFISCLNLTGACMKFDLFSNDESWYIFKCLIPVNKISL